MNVIQRSRFIDVSNNYVGNLAFLDIARDNHQPAFIQRMLKEENVQSNS